MESLNPTILSAIFFILGLVSALVLLVLKKTLQKPDREADIAFLQFERDHREQIRDSKIHRDRSFRKSVFAALLFLGLAIVMSVFVLLTQSAATTAIHYVVLVVVWFIYLVYVFVLWLRYKAINNYQQYLYKIDAKMVKARKKLKS